MSMRLFEGPGGGEGGDGGDGGGGGGDGHEEFRPVTSVAKTTPLLAHAAARDEVTKCQRNKHNYRLTLSVVKYKQATKQVKGDG
jgi:hypothetical protein